jgi:hypothetical protein
MKEIWQKELFERFPLFFKYKEDKLNSAMGFGFECGDGWFFLLHDLFKRIEEHFKGDIPESFYVTQVKEKFGGLRVYISSAPREVHDMIWEAELRSFFVCEDCGAVNDYVKGVSKTYKSFYRDKLGWISTLCNRCLRKHIKSHHLPDGDYISDWQKENEYPYKLG